MINLQQYNQNLKNSLSNQNYIFFLKYILPIISQPPIINIHIDINPINLIFNISYPTNNFIDFNYSNINNYLPIDNIQDIFNNNFINIYCNYLLDFAQDISNNMLNELKCYPNDNSSLNIFSNISKDLINEDIKNNLFLYTQSSDWNSKLSKFKEDSISFHINQLKSLNLSLNDIKYLILK